MNGSGRPLKHSVTRDGFTACAQYVVDLTARQRDTFNVYLARDGGVRVIPTTETRMPKRPEYEHVGTYRRRLQCEPMSNAPTVESVEADMREHWATLIIL